MQTHPLSSAFRACLCQAAVEASLILDFQLNTLLDAYDFYTQRYPATTAQELFELQDLMVVIKALGTLPHEIAIWISNLRNERSNVVSAEGFEINTLNEFALHMHSLALFMHRKHIDLESFDARLFGRAIETLRLVNRRIG